MKLAFLLTLFITIKTLFYFFLKLYSVNHHQNYKPVFIFIACCVFYVHPHTLTDDISTLAVPFLDWYVYLSPTAVLSLEDQETTKHVENNSRDDELTRHYDHEGQDRHDITCDNHDHAVAGYCNECGYEGDNEDNGDYEDDDFNERIEEFIAVKKREWREEMITESLLCIKATNL